MELVVTSKVHVETDLDNEDVALLSVEGARDRKWRVRDSSGVDEVGGCFMALSGEGLLYRMG